MTTRIITDSNGRKHITNEPQLHPPKRTAAVGEDTRRAWVGLTDEEMKKVWYAMQNIMGWYSFQEIAKAIEAKLKAKNERLEKNT